MKTNSLPPIKYESPRNASPIITSISPTSGLAGVTKITITGQNFSTIKSENIVYFNQQIVSIDSATSTKIILVSPNIAKDSIKVKIAVLKAEEFSNTVFVKLEAAISEFGNFGTIDEPWGTTTDNDGNMYVSLIISGAGVGIKKITSAGVKSDYATSPGVTKFSNLRMGPDGFLYAARVVKAIYRIPVGGGTSSIWISFGQLGTIFDFEFDANGNIWAGGNNDFVNSIKPDKTVKQFALVGNVRSVKVNNNFLYVAGTFNNAEKIMRAQIFSADSLSSWEEYFNLTTSSAGGSGINLFAIGFASDGNIYLGTDASTPIIVLKENKSIVPLYPGVLSPLFHIFAKGPIGYIYGIQGIGSAGSVTNSKKIFKIVVLQ